MMIASFLRARYALLATLLGACGPQFAVQQSSFATLPTAPPPAAVSGRGALDLGAGIATDAGAGGAVGGRSGLSVARVQPEGALTLRVADMVALRAWGAVALPQGSTQVTGDIDAPEDAAWLGTIGPVFRLLAADGLMGFDIGTAFGFAVVASNLEITRTDCPSSGPCEDAFEARRQLEVMPIFALRLDLSYLPTEWLRFRIGGTVRNQPVNEASFNRSVVTGSSVSAGPIGIVLQVGADVDFTDEIGMRAELQWPAFNLGLSYGPIVTLAVQGRIGGSLRDPLGLRLE
ncbi:MAG: hypothetical protein AB7S26_21010 [Sandaracinaceae bacterium]